ncbi:hypothetical protein ATORI0001_1207 [Lancefieldella rimae ATCC 49626]|uniref:Uncharacterized protein n=1 Tax=Lancefieldella rimae (strain ATCC 49626 / DSM 7090 / CCUG 31168 / NBRC 15546 / VPI D140H-11A) TaxID=553184 RepID=B9CLN0_LANR4|nr:hypothetical protein ATORI0001_1207 [Lancefieldella rimae ATCC 49626]
MRADNMHPAGAAGSPGLRQGWVCDFQGAKLQKEHREEFV